jgi:hypothetical protein
MYIMSTYRTKRVPCFRQSITDEHIRYSEILFEGGVCKGKDSTKESDTIENGVTNFGKYIEMYFLVLYFDRSCPSHEIHR